MTTTVTTGPAQIVRPTTKPLTSSVLAHAEAAGNVKTYGEGESFGMVNDNGLWPSYNCIDTLIPTAMCPEPTLAENGDFKQFSFAGQQPGFTFANMAGVQCLSIGLDAADMKSEIERVAVANEGRGVEEALLGNRFVAQANDADSPLEGSWADPVDITPTATALTLAGALALLEGYAARNYAGIPTIHMPRAAATFLETTGLIVWVGDLAFTKNGSKVAMGGGYDPESIDTGDWDGDFDLYATGEVYIERSAEFSISAMTSPSDGSGIESDQNGLRPNTVIVLVERMFRVGVDCFVAKATGTAPTSGGFGN